MADDTFVAATLARYLELNPGMAEVIADLSPDELAYMLRVWLQTRQGQRAILRAEIARLLAEEDRGGAG